MEFARSQYKSETIGKDTPEMIKQRLVEGAKL